ncbi:MAG: FHA domain-containing protein [Nannocystaceae bacterium]|nr:FHA domain-containing protein [Nannocystaceae bacterium]
MQRSKTIGTEQPSISVTAGGHCGQRYLLDEGEWIVGKGEGARIRLLDSGVSRRHAKIVMSSDGMVVVIDLQSTNGTFVNDQRVEMSALREGARIGVGPDAELLFSQRPVAAPETPAMAKPKLDNPLTKRETEIARLVADGLTNPKIAERLGIKTGTVSSHLDNVYARLRISGRAALTRWFIEAGL